MVIPIPVKALGRTRRPTPEPASASRAKRPWSAVLWLALAMLAMTTAPASQAADQTAQAEGTYLVNFIRYTEWPEDTSGSTQSPYVISVAGPPWLTKRLAVIARTAGPVRQRPLAVRRLSLPRGSPDLPPELQAELLASHVLFIHSSAGALQQPLLDAVRGHPVLTVGTADGFTDAGGMFGLRKQRNSHGFEANTGAINASGLRVSAKVLKLARDDGGHR